MADIDKEITVKVKAEDDTQKATQSAKARLRELQAQMLTLEQQGHKNTAAFRELSAEAGELKDAIGDTSAQVKVLSSDTRTLDTFTSAIQGVAGGFAVAQGAAALFGEENEDIQKAMMKVQAAMALVNGATALANTLNKDSALMVNLNAAAQRAYALAVGTSTGALKAFRIALVTTGLGALVVALGFAVDALMKFTNKTKDNTDAQKENDKALQDTVGTLEYYERKLLAFGGTEVTLAKDRKARLEKESAMMQQLLDADIEKRGKRTDAYQKSLTDELDLLNTQIKEQQNIIDKDAKEKQQQAQQESKQTSEKSKQKKEAEKREQQEINNIIKASRQALFQATLSDNERELEEIDQSYEERLAKVKGNEEATNLLLQQLRAERIAKIQEQQDKADQDELDEQRQQLDYMIQIEDEFFAQRQKQRELELAAEKDLNQKRVELNQIAYASIAEILRGFGGKSKAVMLAALALEKAAAIAQVIINLQKETAGNASAGALHPLNALVPGFGQALASKQNLIARKAAALRIATIAATGLSQAISIGKGGNDEQAGTGGGASTGGGMAAPQGNVLNPSGQLIDPNTGQAMNTQPLRAYVVESDVSGVQQRLRQIREFAQLGTL